MSATNKLPGPESASTAETNVSNTIVKSSNLTKLIKCSKDWAQAPNPEKMSSFWAFYDLLDEYHTCDKPPLTFRFTLCTKSSIHTWSRGNGSNSMLPHLQRTHNDLVKAFESYTNKGRKKNQTLRNTTITEIWKKLTTKMYSQTGLKQIKLDRTIGLFVFNGLHTLCTVNHFWFIKMKRCANNAMHVPSRARLIDFILPRLNKEASNITRKALAYSRGVIVSFDLWITAGPRHFLHRRLLMRSYDRTLFILSCACFFAR